MFYDLCLSRLVFEHQTFRLQGLRSYQLRHRPSQDHEAVLDLSKNLFIG